MNTLTTLFFILLFIVFYTYLGYGILLWILVEIKQMLHPAPNENADGASKTSGLPEVTLFITAYNEEKVVDGKMKNCHELDYPKDKLKIVWVTDGSNDHTNNKLKEYADATVLFTPERKGKTAAMNRGMRFVTTPIVVFTDANTFINNQAIREIVNCFNNPKVGCVAGEKRVDMNSAAGAAAGGEGLYWKYESFLKKLDYQLYSAIGAAGELFAIRTSLYEEMPADTLLDDFILSLRITMKKYIIAYCDTAYALESGSADMKEEEKRKVRISAGGLQSIYRLNALLNPLRYGVLSFQYISHRVLRWSVTPVALFLLFPLNVILAIYSGNSLPYIILLLLQILFYIAGFYGYYLSTRSVKNKLLYIPYYFLFMNINVIKGFFYLKRHKGGAWEKARRA
ncbi:MAG: glycosyltransferase family 2 protein [Bacteroides sp.]|nr:glycosyltransferase family 2 protein [Bacteroides sp.]